MQEITKSASKIVFILMALGVIGLTAAKIMDVKDFVVLASMSFTFYFSNKGSEENNFLGK